MASSRIDELRRRLDKDPGSRLFAQLAEELRKDGELAEAIGLCREGLRSHPNYPSARMTLGRALLDTGDYRGARAEFEAVLRGAPDNILASRLLAESLEALGELELALAQYRTTLTLAPEDRAAQIRERQLAQRVQGASPRQEAEKVQATAPPVRPPVSAVGPPGPPEPASPPMGPIDDGRPIPLVEADEEFELETAYDAPTTQWGPRMQTAAVDASAPAAATETAASGDARPAAPVPAEKPDDLFASATLAELYLSQGLTDRAIQVYRQVVAHEPSNATARQRLAEIEGHAGGRAAPALDRPASVIRGPSAARQEALRRTIGRLEGFLAAVRERRPA